MGCRLFRRCITIVVVIFMLRALRRSKRLFQALFSGGFGVGLAVADGEGGLIFGESLVAFVADVVNAPEIDVGPCEQARIGREANGFAEALFRGLHLALHDAGEGEDVICAAWVGCVLGESLFGQFFSACRVALMQPDLGKVESVRLAGGMADDVR